MNEIQIFSNPQFGEIRTAIGEDGEPLFCLVDVAKALGYSRPADAVSKHCKGVVILPTPTNGGIQQIKFGKEGDVYRLVMKSKLPEAGIFQDWVCDEVLPTIRRHGAYATPATIESIIANPENGIKLLTALKEEREQRLLAEKRAELEAEINKANAPKVLFADAVAGASNSCLIGELAKILTQNGYKIGQNRLFEKLRNEGYLGVKGEYYNMPNQRYQEMGLFDVKKRTINNPDGSIIVKTTTKVTGKGQQYFINKFLNEIPCRSDSTTTSSTT